MALAPGTRLGPYEITALIGEGGMGKVWRARHTALKRDDALKVLPDPFVGDPERLARFQREAQLLASINHPNIAHVYGLEQADGVHALVMELVEGPTLADRIAQGPMALGEAVPIARQIAEALEAAHEQGIVHRDLKPSNVKVRDDGVVKVLDFGLAKAMEPVGAAPASSMSPTITTPAMTQMGMVLGTAAYMSPEQAKGRAVDKRSDVWAFGCVLYEMLTGRRAFDAEDTSDTLALVLKGEPDWTLLPPDTPAAIRTLIQRCLVKSARQRVADLSVASFLLAESRTLESAPSSAATVRMPRWRAMMPVAAAIIATALLVGLAAWSLRPPVPDRPVMRLSYTLPAGQLLPTQFRQIMAISPDGQRLVYVASGRLHLHDMSEFGSRVIVDNENALTPAFSPDGNSIAFVGQGGIRRMPVGGGASVLVCGMPPGQLMYSLTWDASGIVFVQNGRVVSRCPVTGGKPEQLAMVDASEFVASAQILPGGQAILLTIGPSGSLNDSGSLNEWEDTVHIVVQSLATGERRTIIERGSDGRYSATGHLLYSMAGSVLAVPFDLQRQIVTGSAVSVIEGVRRGGLEGGSQFVTSMNGHLLYVPGPAQASARFTPTISDRSGAVTPLKLPPDRYIYVRASHDGKQLAIGTDNGKEADVSTYEVEGTSALKRLTFGGRNQFPIWSPDDQRIAFQSDRDGDAAIFVQRVDGTGLQRLTKPEKGDIHVPESWSPDGKHIAYSVQKGDRYSLWVYSVVDGQTTRFSTIDSLEPTGADFSADGKWIAYHSFPPGASARTSSSGIFLEPFPGANTRHQAPKVTRDFQPVWSRDGTELFYIATATSGEVIGVPVSVKAGVTFGTPKGVPFLGAGGRLSGQRRVFDVLPDGRFVGLGSDSDDRSSGTTRTEIRVVLNWTEELKRLVPAK